MKIFYSMLVGLTLFTAIAKAQNTTSVSPCSADEILARHLDNNPKALLEIEANEDFTKAFVKQIVMERASNNAEQGTAQYTIPVVLHVFHYGDDGKIDSAQAQSGIDILNNDFNGLNDDWNTIDPEFDSIKGTLDIQFCLASLDPNGDSTSGVIYYEDSLAMLNIPDLFQYAWDNYKYLNIYLPKYTSGSPSLFTAYAYYPSTSGSNSNTGGIFYSSIRWGYGGHSELDPGQDWASVGTHEVGHWLNLRHTFENGCNSPGDYVDDTPPTLGGAIELSGCTNNDLSCSVSTNGENYMDYNHDCKKMFSQGQADRMTAALNLPSRITLWSPSNLAATGCLSSTPINCSQLEVTDMVIDNNNLTIDITIYNGDTIQINYPYVGLVIDNNGDTIQNGSSWIFVQFAGDTVTFSYTLNSVSPVFPLTVYFAYSDMIGGMGTDTCVLSYAAPIGIPEPPTKPKELLYITDVLGRTTYPVPNRVLFYIYDEGSVEKKIRLER